MNTKNPKIIILAGKARAGKDTFASFIKDYAQKNNLKYANLQFSYYIKMYAKILSDWDGSEETKPRTLLQQLGTEVIRYQIDNEFFIKRIIDDIKVLSYFCDIITISDARLPEELDLVTKAYDNSVKIKIERPSLESELTSKEQHHATEIGLNNYTNYDYIIQNDGSIEDLKEKAHNLIKEIL